MSPILVRPVREQLEHDRVIRLLQAKFRRKYEVGINPGAEQTAAVGVGAAATYPDVVVTSQDRGHRLQAVIEVETGESVNHLEALAQWGHLGRLRAEFHLYVPAGMVDVARRLCEENRIRVNEIWSYHTVIDQVRFTLVHRNKDLPALPPAPKSAAKPTVRAVRPVAKPAVRPAAARPKPAASRKPAVRLAKSVARSTARSGARKTARTQKRK